MAHRFIIQDLLTICPLVGLFSFAFLPLLLKIARKNSEPHPLGVLLYAFTGLIVATGFTASIAGLRTSAFSDAIVFDGVTVWASYLVYGLTAFALMLAYDSAATRGRQFSEFVFMTMSAAIGMLILVMANDLIVTFIGIETMSLSLYLLIALSRETTLAKEAAFKYFVLGSFASAIFLYGVSFIYGTVGGTTFPLIADNTAILLVSSRLFITGLGLVILGFGFKVAMFPMHAWVPDVYQGAPTPVTTLMSTAVKAVTFVAFLRFIRAAGFVSTPSLESLLEWLAVGTMIIGNVAAFLQDNFKRMLAWSSVAHSGYAIVGLICAGFGSNFDAGATSLLFYLFSYSVVTVGTFAVVALFEKNENTQLAISDLKGLAHRHPWLALGLTVLMLSLAGIPPTLGFFGKLYILSAAIEQDYYWLALWTIIASLISVAYYLRPVVMMYMSDDESLEPVQARRMTLVTVYIAAIAVIVVGIFSAPVLRAIQASILSLV